jgi:ATP-dependent Clp protease ATP-binding subunit ClpA
MFERFTSTSRTVVKDARDHARRLGHGRVGSEHLLLAIASSTSHAADVLESFGATESSVEALIRSERDGDYARDREALASIGIDLDQVREAMEATFGPGALDDPGSGRRRRRWRRRARRTATPPGRSPFAPRAKKCLELSLREAIRLRQPAITPEHLALGILREGQGLGCLILQRLDVSFDALRAALETSSRRTA